METARKTMLLATFFTIISLPLLGWLPSHILKLSLRDLPEVQLKVLTIRSQFELPYEDVSNDDWTLLARELLTEEQAIEVLSSLDLHLPTFQIHLRALEDPGEDGLCLGLLLESLLTQDVTLERNADSAIAATWRGYSSVLDCDSSIDEVSTEIAKATSHFAEAIRDPDQHFRRIVRKP